MCTAKRKTKDGIVPCWNTATQPQVRNIHPDEVCATCWKRLRRQGAEFSCSEPSCGNLIVPKVREERTKPQPWCRLHEYQAFSIAVIGQEERSRVFEDFFANVQSDWSTGCWNWIGRTVSGYGIYKGRKAVGPWKAHRLAWHLFNPVGHARQEEIDHRCANGLCVNILHLQPVTEGLNKQLRDERRADPTYVWHAGVTGANISLNLLALVSSNKLVFRTPWQDYSKPWEPTHREKLASITRPTEAQAVEIATEFIDATWIETMVRDKVESLKLQPEQRKGLVSSGMKARIVDDLHLTKEEGRYLRQFKTSPGLRRRLRASETRTRAR